MSDVFISDSIEDEIFARNVKNGLGAIGVNAFLTSISLEAGSRWKDGILSNLK